MRCYPVVLLLRLQSLVYDLLCSHGDSKRIFINYGLALKCLFLNPRASIAAWLAVRSM